jgi:hypothetical protein
LKVSRMHRRMEGIDGLNKHVRARGRANVNAFFGPRQEELCSASTRLRYVSQGWLVGAQHMRRGVRAWESVGDRCTPEEVCDAKHLE